MNKEESISTIGSNKDVFIPGRFQVENTERIRPLKAEPEIEVINQAGAHLLEQQHSDGYWTFEVEADSTIPSEYLLLQFILGKVNNPRVARITKYILRKQLGDGSWPLYEAGPGNISATVKAYLVLKLTGHNIDSNKMISARNWILSHGGAESCNVFTRITLALFGQLPWHTVPAMPVEIICLPKWWLFSLHKVSYWSRCVIVPLLIVLAVRPIHKLAVNQSIRELFLTNPEKIKHIDKLSTDNVIKSLFFLLDRLLKIAQQYIPQRIRARSLDKCEKWTREHMQGEGGNGAIFPAMANAVMALKLRGCADDDPDLVRGINAIEDLVIDAEHDTYVQPCVSPVWDTCLALSAVAEAGLSHEHTAIKPAIDWLFEKQVFTKGDWARRAPGLESGGWAFQFENGFYPDLDDTSMVVMCMLRNDIHKDPEKLKRINQAVSWVKGMQNSDGGWGAFDKDNHYEYLNNIPFADHGALVDPSTADLTARCIEMLTMLGHGREYPPIARGLNFIKKDQKSFGGWFGRWGVNYIYGTWSVIAALAAMEEDPNQAYIRKAVKWLKGIQNPDGGWGEDCSSYDDMDLCGQGISTPSQTAWALMGLIAIGEVNSECVEKGIKNLIDSYILNDGWVENLHTGTGFPRVFYLRYYGYCEYFPLWALGMYHTAKSGIPSRQKAIMNNGKIISLFTKNQPAKVN